MAIDHKNETRWESPHMMNDKASPVCEKCDQQSDDLMRLELATMIEFECSYEKQPLKI